MSANNKKSLDPAVMAALITVIGGIIIALINVLANRPLSQAATATPYPTWTNVPTSTLVDTPVPTDTVAAGEPSSTPAPPTETPEPTATLAPPALGEDWANDCISSLWQVVPAVQTQPQENGCLQPPVGDFSASNGQLFLVANRRFNGVEIHGIFAPLPAQDGEVSLKVDLSVVDKGEVWMGVFSQPSTDSNGAVVYIPPGDIQKRLLVLLSLPGNSKSQTRQYNPSNAVYDVKFTYNPGSVTVSVMNDDQTFSPVPVGSAQKWLFIGYRTGSNVNNIAATFFDLAFK